MKIIIFGIIAIIILSNLNIQNIYGHNPDFEVNSSEEILKFCEFFYEEYQLIGVESLVEQHPQFPNLRACVILYNHIAWNSTHQARDLVLIAEIEKYLGDSNHIRERHIEFSDTIPEWIKSDAQLWIKNEKQDVGFAYGIRTLLEAGVISLDYKERKCIENEICLKENDFMKYSFFDKYGNNVSLKHIIKSIRDNSISVNDSEITIKDIEIIIEIEKTSRDGKESEEIILNKEGLIKTEECCKYYEFIIPLPIKLGDNISDNVQVIAETTFTLDNQVRDSWLASDTAGQNVKVIDKKTGLVFSHEFHETEVLTVGDETKMTDTNFFSTKYNMGLHQTIIPEWWKTTTSWLLDGKITDAEYLRAIENLISRNIIRV